MCVATRFLQDAWAGNDGDSFSRKWKGIARSLKSRVILSTHVKMWTRNSQSCKAMVLSDLFMLFKFHTKEKQHFVCFLFYITREKQVLET